VSRLRRILLVLAVLVIGLAVFVVDVIALTGTVNNVVVRSVRELALIGAVLLMVFYARGRRPLESRKNPRGLGRLLLLALETMLVAVTLSYLPTSRFTAPSAEIPAIIPGNFPTVFVAMVIGLGLAYLAIETLLTVQQLLFYKRKKGTKRNFTAYVVVLLGASVLTLPWFEAVPGLVALAVYVLAILLIVVNAFRQGWVVYLSRREKIYSILYSLFLALAFVGLTVLVSNPSFVSRSLEAVSAPIARFVGLNCLLGATYFGMAFVSTLFHLPTAEVYERKQSELSSLHNLSRLVTQVFDFNELVSTVTQMTREVCGARSAWLELVKVHPDSEEPSFELAALDNISAAEIETINSSTGGFSLRSIVLESKRVLMIEEAGTDKRTVHLRKAGLRVESLLSVPLVRQDKLIGILNATSAVAYGFDQDDIDVPLSRNAFSKR
jgi:hypothetical protein